MSDRRVIPPLSCHGNINENWKMWKARFENYLVASEVNKKDENTQCAQLLHYIGEQGFKIYSTFKFEENEVNKLKPLLTKFDSHFIGKENIAYERYKFFTYKQQEGQSTDDFIIEVKKRAEGCKLGNLKDSLTVTVITCGIKNDFVREKLLEDDSMSLEKAIEKCLVIESSKQKSVAIGHGSKYEVEGIYKTPAPVRMVKNCIHCQNVFYLIKRYLIFPFKFVFFVKQITQRQCFFRK